MYDTPVPKTRADARMEALLRETETRLRRQNQVLVDLARRASIHSGNLDEALREITEAAAQTLEVERVSVWFFNDDRSALSCADVFDRTNARHGSGGEELRATNHPLYFRALETERTITASDAQRDPRTSGFNDYHHALGITSMIDAPIRRLGQINGVVCHEHVGPIRFWTVEEENFASSIADLVVIAIDAAERRQTQESLQRRVDFEQLISGISTHFINVAESELDDAIVDALASIAQFAGADRAHVVLLDDTRTTGSMTHEWRAEGLESRRAMLANVPIGPFRWTTGVLMRGENVRINTLADLPPEAEAERRLHEISGNQSVLAVPMVVNKMFTGFVGFNAVRREIAWTDDDVALLRIAGEIFLSAIERTRTERALRTSEERHRLLFQRNLAGLYRNTVDGRILECNDALAHILGFESREELMQQYAPALYYEPREREHFINTLRVQGAMTSNEICLRRKDGTPVWLLESVHLVGGGDAPYVLEGTVIDITDRKFAENALRESELRYRTLIERMREGLAQVDNDGVLQYVNDRFCEIVGYSRDELTGIQAEQLLIATDEDRALMRSKIELRKRGLSDRYEVRVRRKDGRIIWLEIGGAPVFDATGNVVGSIGVHNDVTERRSADEAVRESEARYRLMADNSTDLISRTSKEGVVLYASPAIKSLLGYEPWEVIGHPVFDLIENGDAEVVQAATQSLQSTGPLTFSYRAVRKDGTRVWFETTSRAVVDPNTNEVIEIVSVSRDISERKRAEEQIEYQAYHDALTGLPNRRLFRDRLTVALAHARRARHPVAVMFLDLDSFKVVNDTLGHSLGDELLKIVGTRLSTVLREEDTIARMGGDEFTVLLANIKSEADAPVIAQKLLDAVAQPLHLEGHELFITTSIGIALHPEDGDTAEALLKNADNAMYRAKEIGRNSYQLCAASVSQRSVDRLSVENALRRAIDRGEFELHYQPQIRVNDGAVVGMEALLRWNRPEHGIVMPETFIPIAEETRLIVPIGEWVLREACKQAMRWPRLRMAVNLSPRQFQQSDLRDMIAAALDAAGLDASVLEVEITESTAMHNTERTVATMRSLREMGVRIALDDFGTGHSALNYLRSFPIDCVKIDQAFVHEIEASVSDRAIVSAVIAMAHGMGLRVTAEGVETEEQLQFLRGEGCEEVQGYLFGRPAPATTGD
jgi:diguanylate cyclase (GGDEF)-like protein/PAS domain S-box-containing protein